MKTDLTDKIKAIGFDVDGTLYHSPSEMTNWIARELVETVAKHINQEFDEAEEEYIRRRDEYKSNTLTLNSFGIDGEKVFQTLFDEVPLEKFVKKDGKLIKFIKRLEKKYKLFIISNGTERQIVKKLEHLGLKVANFSPIVACYDHEGWVKPKPAAFLFALEELQLASEEVVYVGDRIETDIEGARGVGMKTILIGRESEEADFNCERVYDIEHLLVK